METNRLIIRELTPKDALNLYKLNLNTDVIRFTSDVAFESIGEAKKFLENYQDYNKYGVGRWAVLDKETKEFLGWCGIKFSEELKEYDLGFRFLKKHWGKGFATEAAKHCIDLAFSKYKINELVGRVQVKNKASHRVLNKIGMKHIGSTQIDKVDWEIFKLTNPAL